MSVASYFGIGSETGTGPQSLDEWKKLLDTSVERSTSPPAIIEGLRSVGLAVEARQNMTIDDLEQCFQEGKPVICPIQEYGKGDEKREFNYGHYVAVVGVGMGSYVFVQDSTIDNVMQDEGADYAKGRMMIDAGKFLGVWHDEDVDGNAYVHFGIIVSPGGEQPHNRLKSLATEEIDKGVLDTVQTAGRWLADKWQQLENRYGRKTALSMAVAMLATAPLPGSIPAIIAVAEGIRRVYGKEMQYAKGLLGDGLIGTNRPNPRAGQDKTFARPVNRLKVTKRSFMQIRVGPYDVEIIREDDGGGWYAELRDADRVVHRIATVPSRSDAVRAATEWANRNK